MQPISSYSTTDGFIRLLLQGAPGSGKSTLSLLFPGVYVIDIDVNLAGPIRYHTKRNHPLPIGYDRLDLDDKGNPVPLAQRFTRLSNCLLEAQKNPEVQTIVIQSATGLSELMMEYTKIAQPACKDGRQLFGFFYTYCRALINTLTQMRKHVILEAHEKIEQDAMTQVTQYRLSWPGQLGDHMGGFFTNVWRTEVTRSGVPPKYSFQVRTMQDAQCYGLKNDFELPPTFEFDWKIIEGYLKGTTK